MYMIYSITKDFKKSLKVVYQVIWFVYIAIGYYDDGLDTPEWGLPRGQGYYEEYHNSPIYIKHIYSYI